MSLPKNKPRVAKQIATTMKGFTLLEVLIAMAMFAIMSVMAYSGLKVLLDARVRTAEKSAHLAQLQMTLYMLNEDLSQSVSRSVRDEYGTKEPVFKGGENGELLTLTRGLPAWTKYQNGSQLQRVSYRFENGALYRQAWGILDRTQQSTFRRRKLIDLENIQLRFFEADWLSHWSSTSLPKAVECVLTLPGFGDVKRLFFVHD